MLTVTGLIAAILVFLAGPYRTLQKRRLRIWDGRVLGHRLWGSEWWGGTTIGGPSWGPVNSVYTHANISLWALVAVFLHVSLTFEIGTGLTYIATLLFVVSFASGLYGMFLTKKPRSRRQWMWFHRRLTLAFYVTILWHVFTEGVLGWPAVVLIAFGTVLWTQRSEVAKALSDLPEWPFHRIRDRQEPTTPAATGRSAGL